MNLLGLDKSVLYWINGHHNVFLDAVLAPVAYAGEVAAIWALVFIALMVIGKPGYRHTALLMLVTVLLTDRVVGHYMGEIFDRNRPYAALEGIRQLGIQWKSGSFPSGHAHSVCVAAVILGERWQKLIWPLAAFAVLTCYSRPYFGMHYPIDTLAGAAAGTAMGFLAIGIDRRWLRRKKATNE